MVRMSLVRIAGVDDYRVVFNALLSQRSWNSVAAARVFWRRAAGSLDWSAIPSLAFRATWSGGLLLLLSGGGGMRLNIVRRDHGRLLGEVARLIDALGLRGDIKASEVLVQTSI